MRVGTGWDIHRLVENRKLVLGGVEIEYHLGFEAHSDGDVLIHALIDALLGSLALGDIGQHFPPTDPKYKDIDSKVLLKKTIELLGDKKIVNIDSTIIAEKPKLLDHISRIRASLASLCSLEIDQVSVKAKTAEKMLGEVGQGEAIIAQVTLLVTD